MNEFVQASHVFLNNTSKDVHEALAFLANKAVSCGVATDEAAVLEAFEAREAEGTTGMMEGFAIPHGKSDAISEAAVFVVKFAGDVEWEAMDNKPIKIAIALLVPGGEAGTTHLQLLSKLAVMLMDENFRTGVLGAEDEALIAERINAALAK